MGWLSDLHKGNKHWFSEQWKAIKNDPERLFLGAMTPVGSKLWGGITGEDYKPVMDAWGGPSADVYATGAAKGINMDPAHNSHRIARMVAAMSMAGGGSGGERGTGTTQMTPAQIESAVGTPGYGVSSATPGLSAGGAGGGWQDMLKNMNMGGGQQGGGNQQDLERQRRQALLLQQMQQHDMQQKMQEMSYGR